MRWLLRSENSARSMPRRELVSGAGGLSFTLGCRLNGRVHRPSRDPLCEHHASQNIARFLGHEDGDVIAFHLLEGAVLSDRASHVDTAGTDQHPAIPSLGVVVEPCNEHP